MNKKWEEGMTDSMLENVVRIFDTTPVEHITLESDSEFPCINFYRSQLESMRKVVNKEVAVSKEAE